MTIKSLCIIEDLDRPTTATFIGLKQAGIDIRVICPSQSSRTDDLSAAGIPIIDIDVHDCAASAAKKTLREHLQHGGYDILHLFGNRSVQNGLAASRGMPIKIIAYRGIVGNVSFLDPSSWRRFLNRRIDKIICVADAIRYFFLQMNPAFLRIPAERIITIHKGHDLAWYNDTPADLSRIGIPANAFVIVCVANYRPRKGIEKLVAAMQDLPESWRAHLLLIGNMEGPKLNKAISASPAKNRIHRAGYRSDASSLVAACDVFVLPSIKREGLARSLIEAMAYGVAPVVTDCGGSPELVVDGESGLVIPVNDIAAISTAISKMHENADFRRQMGAAARIRIGTHFRIEDTIEKTLKVYQDLVSPA